MKNVNMMVAVSVVAILFLGCDKMEPSDSPDELAECYATCEEGDAICFDTCFRDGDIPSCEPPDGVLHLQWETLPGVAFSADSPNVENLEVWYEVRDLPFENTGYCVVRFNYDDHDPALGVPPAHVELSVRANVFDVYPWTGHATFYEQETEFPATLNPY